MDPTQNPNAGAQTKVLVNRRLTLALGCLVIGILFLLFIWSHAPRPDQPEGLREAASLICIVHSIFGVYLSMKGDFDKKS